MSYSHDNNEGNQVHQYSGVPNKHTPAEASKWRKFIKAVFPWIARKWDLGNAFLEARVEKEVNEAAKIKAETVLLRIEAEKKMREIVEMADQQEHENTKELIELAPLTDEQFEIKLNQLSEEIRRLYLVYGTQICISIEIVDEKSIPKGSQSEGQAVELGNTE